MLESQVQTKLERLRQLVIVVQFLNSHYQQLFFSKIKHWAEKRRVKINSHESSPITFTLGRASCFTVSSKFNETLPRTKPFMLEYVLKSVKYIILIRQKSNKKNKLQLSLTGSRLKISLEHRQLLSQTDLKKNFSVLPKIQSQAFLSNTLRQRAGAQQ